MYIFLHKISQNEFVWMNSIQAWLDNNIYYININYIKNCPRHIVNLRIVNRVKYLQARSAALGTALWACRISASSRRGTRCLCGLVKYLRAHSAALGAAVWACRSAILVAWRTLNRRSVLAGCSSLSENWGKLWSQNDQRSWCGWSKGLLCRLYPSRNPSTWNLFISTSHPSRYEPWDLADDSILS